MSKVRSRDTKPELLVRRLVHRLGYRYRLHGRGLPGTPDLVFSSRRKVVFVHGCFWHRHDCRLGDRLPKSRQEFWKEKLDGNRRRDVAAHQSLRDLGWESHVVWECEVRDLNLVAYRLQDFLGAPRWKVIGDVERS